jgi:hypothetical protein
MRSTGRSSKHSGAFRMQCAVDIDIRVTPEKSAS